MRISLIVAMTPAGIIGDDNGLPWHLPRDLRRFRELTWGKPIVMGRKTFASIGKPLPGRPNIVLTRDAHFRAEGCHVANDVPAALRIAARLIDQEHAGAPGTPVGEVMVVGGGEVYRQFIDSADRVYLTLVHGDFPGTATFPVDRLRALPWRSLAHQQVDAGPDNPVAHSFRILERAAEVAGGGRREV